MPRCTAATHWPCVPDTGPYLVPPACSGAPSTAAIGHMNHTTWAWHKRVWRHERCTRGSAAASQAARGLPTARKRPRL